VSGAAGAAARGARLNGAVVRRVLLIAISALALTACRLDATVDVVIGPDGTGTVTVHAVADAELAGKVPGLVDDLRFEDAVAAGWTVDGPATTDTGAVEVTLTHGVSSPEELANVLNSIGPPFTSMAAARTTVDEQTTNAIDGTLTLPDGFQSFADADLVAAVGGLPFEEEFREAGTTPPESMSVTFRVSLPGELVSSTGTEVEPDVFQWTAPLDGSSIQTMTQTVQRPAEGGSWAGPLATAALIALIVWIVLAVAFVAFVLGARRKRAQRRRMRAAARYR
jgi:hypothetical protein